MRVLVFASTGGLGKEVTSYFLKTGHCLVLAGRSAEKLEAQARETGCKIAVVDSDNPTSFEQAFQLAKSVLGGIDAIVSCIGTFPSGAMEKLSVDVYKSDVLANILCAHHILTGAKQHLEDGGSVILTSSCITEVGVKNHLAIAAAKGAIETMALNAAAEMAARKIRVNVVALGLTKTPPTEKIWSKPDTMERLKGAYPLGINEPASVAKAIANLAETSGVTGQKFVIDGGFSAIRT